MILQVMPIKGFSVGIEYDEREDFGFIINCDLGLLRFTWFKDLDVEDEEGDD